MKGTRPEKDDPSGNYRENIHPGKVAIVKWQDRGDPADEELCC